MTGRRHPFLDFADPIAIAHRGGALEAEENTMEAFQHAVDLGFTHVETDVHATRDGVVVIHHDATLERMTGEPARIGDLRWADIAKIRTLRGAAIPRAEDLLTAFPDLKVVFEPKSDRAVEPLADLIRRADALPRICVGSFDPGRTSALRATLGPGLCWSPSRAGVVAIWLAGWGVPVPHGSFQALQVPPVFRGIPVVTPRFVRAAAARGIDVQVWTVDEATEMERLLDIGVRGIMTDRPSVLRQVLDRRGQWHGAKRATTD